MHAAALGATVNKGLQDKGFTATLALDVQASIWQFLTCYAAAMGLAHKLHEFTTLGERPSARRTTTSTISHDTKPPFLVVITIISIQVKKAILDGQKILLCSVFF